MISKKNETVTSGTSYPDTPPAPSSAQGYPPRPAYRSYRVILKSGCDTGTKGTDKKAIADPSCPSIPSIHAVTAAISDVLLQLISRRSPVQSGTPPPNPASRLDSILGRTSYSSRQKDSLSCSIHNTHLRRLAVAERHSNSAHTVRRLNESSHRDRRFGAGPPFHSLNRRRRVACQPYTLGSTWDTSFVF